MFSERTSVGLDVHARSIQATGVDVLTGEVFKATLVPDAQVVIGWLNRLPGPVAVVYEAGPTGYWLCRELRAAHFRCEVAAPSKIARPSGDFVKTDKKDALLLANALRTDQHAPIHVLHRAQEQARDLTRARDDVRVELMAIRHRTSKMLLRNGIVYDEGQAWTLKHRAWLHRQRPLFAGSGQAAAYESYLEHLWFLTDQRDRMDQQINELAASSDFIGVTRRLACLRGIDTLSGFAIAVEIGDFTRFTPNRLASFLGLVPSENSSGPRTSRGPITKAGNTHARRLMIEAAWHHRGPYRAGRILRSRWALVDDPAVAVHAHKGNHRLHQRWVNLDTRKLNANIANTAIARELAMWCWALATME